MERPQAAACHLDWSGREAAACHLDWSGREAAEWRDLAARFLDSASLRSK